MKSVEALKKNAKPIIFNRDMIKAILDGNKTQTRRVIKPQSLIEDWDKNDKNYGPYFEDKYGDSHLVSSVCPYGQPGDLLYVRETFGYIYTGAANFSGKYRKKELTYKADHYGCIDMAAITWKPSIHMPKKHARIWLEITGVRVERILDISKHDAVAEGVERTKNHYRDYEYGGLYASPISSFKSLWNSINEKRGFGTEFNPWVWVVEFGLFNEEEHNLLIDASMQTRFQKPDFCTKN